MENGARTAFCALALLGVACGSGASGEGDAGPVPATDAGADLRGADGLWSMEECKRENATITLECAALGSFQWITAGPKLGCQGASSGAGGRFALDVDAATSVVGLRAEINHEDKVRIESILFLAPAPMPADRLALASPIPWKTTVQPAPFVQRFGAFSFVEARFEVAELRVTGPATANDFGTMNARGRFSASKGRFTRFDTAKSTNYEVDDPDASVEGCFHLPTKVVARP